MNGLIIKHNELTAEEFIFLWETVWGDGPSLEQTRLAMEHTLFRVSIYDGNEIVAMARMIGDMGYYKIKNNVADSRDRGVISTKVNYDYKDFSIYGMLLQYLEDEYPLNVDLGLRYKF